jgi:hypothetical protein
MEKEKNSGETPKTKSGHRKRINLDGYPHFPTKDDINKKSQKEDTVMILGDDIMGDKLDVLGSESDDDRESVGSKDEENNSYSIGGDSHKDFEESTNLFHNNIKK